MRKKRKVGWIVGGVIVAMLVAITLVLQANSADAKMEAKLDEVFRLYGFEIRDHSETTVGRTKQTTDLYWSNGRTLDDANEILRRIEDACQNCTVDSSDWIPQLPSRHVLVTGSSYHSIAAIGVFSGFEPDAFETGEGRHVAISVSRGKRYSFLEWIDDWWPW